MFVVYYYCIFIKQELVHAQQMRATGIAITNGIPFHRGRRPVVCHEDFHEATGIAAFYLATCSVRFQGRADKIGNPIARWKGPS
jgi:hypothetical protein